MKIDKLHIARSQLLTAIELHFGGGDPISVHSLAGAAREIIEVLCRRSGVEPFSAHIKATFPEKSFQEIWGMMNLYRNAFKHADRDDDDIIEQFEEISNDFMIYVAVEDYLMLRKASPVPIQVFQAWFCAVHEDRLNEEVDKTPFRTIFPNIINLSRDQQKYMGKTAVAKALCDKELLSDPRTESL